MVDFQFLYIWKRIPTYELICIKSIKKVMPNAHIMQFSDWDTPKLKGVHAVERFKPVVEWDRKNTGKIWLECWARNADKNAITIDTDMIFDGDVKEVLEGDYDVAICKRSKFDSVGQALLKRSPYQVGFLVVKNIDFWKECWERISKIPEPGWMTSQYIVCSTVDSGMFKTKILDGNIYNRTPRYPADIDERVKVWHYKGGRKEWMKDHKGKEI